MGMETEEQTRRNVVFVLFDAEAEADAPGAPPDWTPLTFLCANQELPVARLHFFYWPRHREALSGIMERLKRDYGHIRYTAQRLPFADTTDILASPENSLRATEFLYEWFISYSFDHQTETYYFYFQGVQNFFRSILFYVNARHMVSIGSLEVEPPSDFVPGAGRLVLSPINLSVYESMANIIRDRKYDAYSFLKFGIKTRNEYFNRTIEQIEFVAVHSRDPILVLGPTGAGKSALVKRIYKLKAQHKNVSGPFVEVNCAAIRGDSAQSMLFGHIRGAFTGAMNAREGLLKTAHLGLLFLDEVGVLGLEEQALLLRAVEDKTFLPLGADRETSSNFQLICGTNLDLIQEVLQGRFRADLFARINMWTFRLPGLAQRPEDIEPNLDFELTRHEEKTGKHVIFAREARRRFLDFAVSPDAPWLGNFRDFTMAVRRMALMADTGVIGVAHVEDETARLRALWDGLRGQEDPPGGLRAARAAVCHAHAPLPHQAGGAYPLAFRVYGFTPENCDVFELARMEAVLRACAEHTTLSEAGRALFAVSRTRRTQFNDSDRLRKFLARYGLAWEEVRARLVPTTLRADVSEY